MLGVLLWLVSNMKWMKPNVQPLWYLHPHLANSKCYSLGRVSLRGAWGASLPSHSQQVVALGFPSQWWYPWSISFPWICRVAFVAREVLVSTASCGDEFCNLSTACMEKFFLFEPIPEKFWVMPPNSAAAFWPHGAAKRALAQNGVALGSWLVPTSGAAPFLLLRTPV